MEIVKYSYYVPSDNKFADLKEIGDHISNNFLFGTDITYSKNRELTVKVPLDQLYKACNFLKLNSKCDFNQLIDITAVDYPGKQNRFELVYILLSLSNNIRIILKSNVSENDIIPSISGIYPNANWLEREVWDMFGLYFKNHSDLRRLLTDYGFSGHPLRKDFPLTGFVELSYSDVEDKVVYKPTQLMQDFRRFDKVNPWLEEDFKDAMKDALSKENNSSETDKS